MNTFRVAGKGRINRDRTVRFSFDGTDYAGFEGDTLASALLANGVHLVGRSFKYHRPRGILSAGSEEPNALVGTDRGNGRFEPNTRATMVEIYEGLTASSQNRWPSLKRDVGAVNDALYMLFSAGFYYKTFMWPKSFWNKVYEPFIRSAAGLGNAPAAPDPDTYASRFAHCDVLVVGAGPAGLAAALEAGRAGAKVMLCDEQAELGGSLLSEPDADINGLPASDWLNDAKAALAAMANVTLLPRTTAIGYYHQNVVGLCQRLTDHLSRRAGGGAARAAVEGAGHAGRARPGGDRETAGVRRQRPAGRHAGGCGAHLSQSLRRQGRQPGCRRQRARQRLARRLRSRPGRRHRRRDRRYTQERARCPGGTRRRVGHQDAGRPYRHRHRRPAAGRFGEGQSGFRPATWSARRKPSPATRS